MLQMNKYIKPYLFFAGLVLCLVHNANAVTTKDKLEKELANTDYMAILTKPVNFAKEPRKFLEVLYLDYHFGKNAYGLKRTEQAIAFLKPKYDANPHQKIFTEQFSNSEVKSLLGTVYLLKAMLLHKQALTDQKAPKNMKDMTVKQIQAYADKQTAAARKQLIDAKKYFDLSISVDDGNMRAWYKRGLFYEEVSRAEFSKESLQSFIQARKLAQQMHDGASVSKLNQKIANQNKLKSHS